ncbi:hypothetical protein ACN6MY_20100 [Peribacillus sp. B-H-3]|uniref:hypothetical protein n=1 Tax=Peribacillus sp. B-H-3 TaxID=3400420 RepID=UPI003B0269E3
MMNDISVKRTSQTQFICATDSVELNAERLFSVQEVCTGKIVEAINRQYEGTNMGLPFEIEIENIIELSKSTLFLYRVKFQEII